MNPTLEIIGSLRQQRMHRPGVITFTRYNFPIAGIISADVIVIVDT